MYHITVWVYQGDGKESWDKPHNYTGAHVAKAEDVNPAIVKLMNDCQQFARLVQRVEVRFS